MLPNCDGESLESSLDCKDIKPINPNGNQPQIFIGRTDVEAEVPILWPSDGMSRLTGKDPDAGWERLKAKKKGLADDEIVRYHH